MSYSLKRCAGAFATATAHGTLPRVYVRGHFSQFGQALSKGDSSFDAEAPRAEPGRIRTPAVHWNSLKRRAGALALATAHGIPSHVCVRAAILTSANPLVKSGCRIRSRPCL